MMNEDVKSKEEKLEIFIGGISVKGANPDTLKKLSDYLKQNSVIKTIII